MRIKNRPMAHQRFKGARFAWSGKVGRGLDKDAPSWRKPMDDEPTVTDRTVADHRIETV